MSAHRVETTQKIITKAPRASILLATDSRADGEVALQKIRHDYKAGRFVVLYFDQAMIAEMQELLERQNELTFLPDATDPWTFQMDYNGNWFEGFGKNWITENFCKQVDSTGLCERHRSPARRFRTSGSIRTVCQPVKPMASERRTAGRTVSCEAPSERPNGHR